MTENTSNNVMEMAAKIAESYVSNPNHTIAVADVPDLVRGIMRALGGSGVDTAISVSAPQHIAHKEPFVNPKKSVFPDYIICLEDGRQLKMLKRHLRKFNLTPDTYRQKWGLSADYPMTAPNYAEHRSQLAKQIGLGQGRSEAAHEAEASTTVTEAPAPKRQPAKLGKAPAKATQRKSGVAAAKHA